MATIETSGIISITMPSIYSGYYVHDRYPPWGPLAWVGDAIARQMSWCREQHLDYNLVASTMLPWSNLYDVPWAYAFCTLIKLEAMRRFLNTSTETFIWMDLDVYPEKDAQFSDITALGTNCLYAPRCKPAYCGYPSALNNGFMYGKLLWTNKQDNEDYSAVSAGMFSLSRVNVAKFWAWLNKDFDIDTAAWWDAYKLKQIQCAERAATYGYTYKHYDFGTDEALIEEWLNIEPIVFRQLGDDVHGLVGRDVKLKFTHYYGGHKSSYPRAGTPIAEPIIERSNAL